LSHHPLAQADTTRTVVRTAAEMLRAATDRSAPDGGPVVPGYELLEELNRGGMGVIYKARQVALGRIVALKVISPAAFAQPDARERFEREVRAAARLNHPNVVTVYHTDLDGPAPYLAMEYVPGLDLLRLVRQSGPLPIADAVAYTLQAAEGLRHTHEQGLIHRDIKPSNLMVVPAPAAGVPARVKILDMGIARPLPAADHDPADGLTEIGMFLGTPDYAAPEQAEDARKADARSDIYSLGGTLYYLLTGEVPFPGKSLAEKLRKTFTLPPPSPAARRGDVPPGLDAVARKMLAREPAARYQTAGDVIAALTQPGAVARVHPTGTLPMSSANFFDQERAALVRLTDAVRARATAESDLTAAFQAATDKADREVGRARKANAAARDKTLADLDAAHADAAQVIEGRHAADQFATNRGRDERREATAERFKAAERKGKTEYQDKLWSFDSLLEGGDKRAKDQLDSLQRKAAAGLERVEGLWDDAAPLVEKAGTTRAAVDAVPDPLPQDDDDPIGRFQKAFAAAEAAIDALRKQVAGAWPVFRTSTRQKMLAAAAATGEKLALAAAACRTLHDHAATDYAAEKARLTEKNGRKKEETKAHYLPQFTAQKRQYEAELERLVADHAAATAALDAGRECELRAEVAGHRTRRAEAEARFDTELAAAVRVHADKTAAATATRDTTWDRAATDWRAATADVTATVTHLRAEGAQHFPTWDEIGDATGVPNGVRFGEVMLDPATIPDFVSADPRLAPPPELAGPVPAFLPFPGRCAVVLRARDDGRAAAVDALQSMMLRFLTGLPAGKMRFTIVDPVGLGDNFAAFMHLADSDEKLVTGQIWTEPRQIEQRLTDLTDHVAAVIQKYLRNQYASIEDYNRAAGEVAEPYRVLVVANFPTGFTPEAAKRLVSIATSGPSCGVCTLVSVDTRAALPRDFALADLEAPSFVLTGRDGRFTPKDAALAPFPLTIDAPPPAVTVARLVQRVGKASKTAARVEVPFEYIAPAPADVWRGSAAKGFEVAVGRAGATRRQLFALGRGTAQHALIAGKTGSGKSTLLHALITNLALIYSPDEAELYLIDFKEGVEFQWYATYRLPHARVVAIQSEREFGLSVLQRLDVILRERGERFRDAGVNDLAGYRVATPGEKSPRILLVVDEFQQFFVEDDKLSQEASLILDRLVRQGRAFGIHVLLGSQSLGGSYSLPRSTIDQMAVRVALQCSEADAQLILSKDNNAARLLSRPGEAIYNDQNGLTEGNDPFQVVWLSEEKREEVLRGLGERAGGKYPPPLVFEGNSAADPARNPALAGVLDAPAWPADVRAVSAWLGDPVAIKEPTAAVFRPLGAANLLLVGQNEEAARGLFAAALLGLAGRLAPPTAGATFAVLDGTPDDADDTEYLRKLAARLPHPTRTPARTELTATLAEFAVEVEKRQKGESTDRTPRFLFVFGAHRFRELRKTDDDFSFGRRGAEREPSPAERFTTILRDGPPLGVHVIAWCDSLTNLNRTFDRPLLREFGMRVLFQMSPTDSSTLMDAPTASKLGRNRALFLQEDQERPEKFRPYGLPDPEWLDQVIEQLHARVGLKEAAAGV